MSNGKPVAIPADLKPMDRLWYSETEYATVTPIMWGYWDMDRPAIHCKTSDGRYMRYERSGREAHNHTPPIIRIERIASAKPKKAKVDRDAAWLLRLLHYPEFQASPSRTKRLRAIARRLQKGTP